MRRVRCYWVSLTVVCAGMCVCVRECECAKLWVWVLLLSAKHFRGSLVNNEHNLACIFLRVNRNWISLYHNDPSWAYTASLYWLRMKITLSSSAAVMKKWHSRACSASVCERMLNGPNSYFTLLSGRFHAVPFSVYSLAAFVWLTVQVVQLERIFKFL